MEPDKKRALANAFIVLFLGYQIGMPLTYYLSDRVYDERFSWRMFSTVRLQECAITVQETAGGSQRAVALDQDLQVAWVNVLKRLRPAVIEKYFARRCAAGAANRVSGVELVGTCQDTDGNSLPARRFSATCQGERAGELREEAPP